MNRAFNHLASPETQRGVTLIVALMIVLLMGILSLAAIRGSGMQESMAGNMRDRNLAFQASESALRQGESVVMKVGALPAFDGTNGLHSELSAGASAIAFTDDDWKDTANVKMTSLALGVKSEPAYIVEELKADLGKEASALGNGVDADSLYLEAVPFRVTVRSVGLNDDSVVKLQSHLKRIP